MAQAQFRIVLHSVPRTRAAGVRYELGRLFEIDDDIASDICGAAPIVLIEGLEPEVAIAVKHGLAALADAGAELHITDAPCDEIPKVNWPELPQLVRDAMGAVARPQAPHTAAPPPAVHEIARFRCPGCAEPLSLVPTREIASVGRPAGGPPPQTPPTAQPAPAEPVAAQPPAAVAQPQPEPQPEVLAEPPSEPQPEPPPETRHPDLEEGPLVRALQEKRMLRESQRLAPVAEQSATTEAPAAAEPEPEPEPEPAAAASNEPQPPSANRAPEPDSSGALDIDEALRLLDNVIEQPAPRGVQPAPAPEPEPVLPELDTLLEETDLGDLSDFELDVELGELAAAPAPAPPPTPPARERAGSSSHKLAPLEPEEALKILESARSPDSSDEMIFERPLKGPVSDELEPLAPEQALALLAQTTAAEKKKKKRSRERTEPPRSEAGGRRASGRKAAQRERSRSQRSGAAAGAAAPSGRTRSGRRRAVEPSDDAPVHGLVLSRIANEAKRQRAAEIISELTGMSREEAQALTRRAVIPVLKGVPRHKAEQALERFRSARISGRVTTRRLG